jgi:hypothetical protein
MKPAGLPQEIPKYIHKRLVKNRDDLRCNGFNMQTCTVYNNKGDAGSVKNGISLKRHSVLPQFDPYPIHIRSFVQQPHHHVSIRRIFGTATPFDPVFRSPKLCSRSPIK